MIIAEWALFLRTDKSNSIPMMNIKRTNPIWLSVPRVGRLAGGNKNPMVSGK